MRPCPAILWVLFVAVACGTDEKRGSGAVPETSSSTIASTHWQTLPVPLEVLSGFTSTQQEDVVAAAAEWATAMGHAVFALTFAAPTEAQIGRRSLSWTFEPDKQHLYFACNTPCETLLSSREGDTLSVFGIAGEPAPGTDIEITGIFDWSAPVRALYSDGATVTTDLRTVLLHEMGHFLGLGHTGLEEDPDSIMLGTAGAMGSPRHTVSDGDARRLRTLYSRLWD